MKGIVFTEFLDLVDETFGEDVSDRIVTGCPLASGGAYTAVGTYGAEELHMLVGALSGETGMSPAALQRVYGQKLIARFVDLYPAFFSDKETPFDFFDSIEEEIHFEVRKLYADAEFPRLETTRTSPGEMTLRYRSARNLPDFCLGMLEGTFAHYGVKAQISRVAGEDAVGGFTDFHMTIGEEEPA